EREVRILHGQGRQRRGLVVAKRVVEHLELAMEDALGPAVTDDVMDGAQQEVLVGPKRQDLEAEQWAAGQIKRPAPRLLQLRAETLPLRLGRQGLQVLDGEVDGRGRVDDLD